MDKNDYINNLKNLRIGPKKIKVERHEVILNERENTERVNDRILKWFLGNPYPNDKQIEKLADQLGMKEPEVENHIYHILSEVLSEGRSKDFKGKYDPAQIKKGIEVEIEHTPNKLIAEKIAKDHLSEIDDYYTHLSKMESSAGIKENVDIIQELFVQSSEIESLPTGKDRDMQILRLGIIAELDASNLYEKLALLAKDKRIKEILLDISQEEKVHVGEFEALLEDIDPEYTPSEDEGEKEVDDVVKKI